ncbi:MAG: zf-TFIIB domain-containing protein [Deltaproteobacteria bacterium]|nr:zf-TFIIB domain-containing protein [Deltaproteobacteria bacterium]
MTISKPSQPEEEYFARLEVEKKLKLSHEKRGKISEAEIKRLKELHWMHCPKCGMDLHPIPYRGVTLDKCFHCHGVYLDDGELEKIAGSESGFLKGLLSLFKS